MNLSALVVVAALAPSASHWTTPLWDSARSHAEEAGGEHGEHHRPRWWGAQCEESHPSLVWDWVDAARGEDGVRPHLKELSGKTVARLLPRLAPQAQAGQVRDGEETWGGPPLVAVHEVLDLCYVEVAAVAEVVGSGAEAFEELGLETAGRGTFEFRHGFDLLVRPSRFILADGARGLDRAAIGLGGTMGWAVAAPGGEENRWLVRRMTTVEVGPRVLWDATDWLALTGDFNAVLAEPSQAVRDFQDTSTTRAPGFKVLVGAIFKVPEEPVVRFFENP